MRGGSSFSNQLIFSPVALTEGRSVAAKTDRVEHSTLPTLRTTERSYAVHRDVLRCGSAYVHRGSGAGNSVSAALRPRSGTAMHVSPSSRPRHGYKLMRYKQPRPCRHRGQAPISPQLRMSSCRHSCLTPMLTRAHAL